jgi:copper chaperone
LDKTMTLAFKVPDMACSACSETITRSIQAIDPAAQVNADLATRQVRIETQASEAAVRQAILAAGYTIT